MRNEILLNKLYIYKFRDSALKLVVSYIHNRQQVMDSAKGLTQPATIKSDVPQWFHLGTYIIFNVYQRHTFVYGTL